MVAVTAGLLPLTDRFQMERALREELKSGLNFFQHKWKMGKINFPCKFSRPLDPAVAIVWFLKL